MAVDWRTDWRARMWSLVATLGQLVKAEQRELLAHQPRANLTPEQMADLDRWGAQLAKLDRAIWEVVAERLEEARRARLAEARERRKLAASKAGAEPPATRARARQRRPGKRARK